jgi:dihydrofolate reductase
MDANKKSQPKLTIVVAWAKGRVIGKSNQLPWHLPEDLQHFKATTKGNTLIMGRKTFESIGRPLPHRKTIVVTRDHDWLAKNVFENLFQADSLNQAIDLGVELGFGELIIAGGGQIYELALPKASRVIATEIDVEVDGDAWFPPLPADQWQCVQGETIQSKTGLKFCINVYSQTKA